MREKSFDKYKQSNDIINGTIAKGYNIYNNSCTFICPTYTFPWRETKLLPRQIKEQIRKSTLIILLQKGKGADSGGK